jgi:branched-chain amino acid transport system ATP-binding protein
MNDPGAFVGGSATPQRPTPLLEVRDVTASYGPYKALFGVSLEVQEASAVALLGSNGAGKSTLARVITGLVPATGGTVRFGGEDVTKMSAWRISRRGMAHVPEGRGVFSSLSVAENLELTFLHRVGRRGVDAAFEKVYDAFPVLYSSRRQKAGTLSGGQQRILSLAKELAAPPRLLVADELSLGLAPVVVDSVYAGLEAIRTQGTAVLVVEQHVNRALELASEAIVLDRGKVVWAGPSSQAAQAMEQVLRQGSGSVAALH